MLSSFSVYLIDHLLWEIDTIFLSRLPSFYRRHKTLGETKVIYDINLKKKQNKSPDIASLEEKFSIE